MKKIILLLIVIAFGLNMKLISQKLGTTYTQTINHRPSGNGIGASIRVKIVYDVFMGEPIIRAVVKVDSYDNTVRYNGRSYSRNEVGDDVFDKIKIGTKNISFDIYHGNQRVSTVYRNNLKDWDVAGSPNWDNLWPGVSASRAKKIFKKGFSIRNARLTSVNYNGLYKLESFLKNKNEYKNLIQQGDLAFNNGDFKEAKRFYSKAKNKTNDKTEAEQKYQKAVDAEKKQKNDKQKQEYQNLIDKGDGEVRRGNYDNGISNFEKAKRFTDDNTEAESKIESARNAKKDKKEENNKKEEEAKKEETEQETAQNNARKAANEEAIRKEKEKREAEERERKRREANKQKQREYEKRRDAQNRKNEEQAAENAMASTAFWITMATFMYDGMGSVDPDMMFEGSNFYVSYDFGMSTIMAPLIYNSTIKSQYYNNKTGNINKTTVKKDNKDIIMPICVDMDMSLGYEHEYGGGGIYGGYQPGFGLTLDSYTMNYKYGLNLFGGFKYLKLFYNLQYGGRTFCAGSGTNSEQFGDGETVFSYKRQNYGIKLSFSLDYERHHLSFGLIKDRILEGDEEDFYLSAPSTQELISSPTGHYSDYIFSGYSFSWNKEHNFTLYLNITDLPYTGKRRSSAKNNIKGSGTLLEFGFIRQIKWYF